MIDISLGSKRRLSDADKNERIALRQTVLNMSMCKLQKHMGRKEPSLFRSVIINNTVQQIEHEMDMELLAEYNNNQHQYFSHCENNKALEMNVDTLFSSSKSNESAKTVPENTDKPFTYNIGEPKKNENKFGAIGDHRKNISSTDVNISPKASPYLSGFMWDAVSFSLAGNGQVLESLEVGNNFNDVDISLYDYDNNFLNANIHNSSVDWKLFPKSCAAEYGYRKSDSSFFEELDQIMQVLVGM